MQCESIYPTYSKIGVHSLSEFSEWGTPFGKLKFFWLPGSVGIDRRLPVVVYRLRFTGCVWLWSVEFRCVNVQIAYVQCVQLAPKLDESELTWRIEGKLARGRQRLTFLVRLHRTTGVKPSELITMLKDRREKEAATAVYARALAWHAERMNEWTNLPAGFRTGRWRNSSDRRRGCTRRETLSPTRCLRRVPDSATRSPQHTHTHTHTYWVINTGYTIHTVNKSEACLPGGNRPPHAPACSACRSQRDCRL